MKEEKLTREQKDALQLFRTTGCVGVLNSAGLIIRGGIVVLNKDHKEVEMKKKQ